MPPYDGKAVRVLGPIVAGMVVVCACVLATASVADAQFRAGIQGTVRASTGNVLPGVSVTVSNKETGRTDKATTSARGVYFVSGLAPGVYVVTARLGGFKSVVSEVVVQAETSLAVNFTLEPGNATEAVGAPARLSMPTESASLSGTITELDVQNLPQVGRDPYELLRLAPNVFGDGARTAAGDVAGLPNVTGPSRERLSIFQTENQVQISANGQRVSANRFTIDGISVNSLAIGGAAIVTPNQESVHGIAVVSGNYSAEDGRNSGALIKVVSRSGTNTQHGSAMFMWSDPALNAPNGYGGLNGAPPVKVEQSIRQYGGSLGGPILRNRLFVFGSFEALRIDKSTMADAWVETPEFRDLVRELRPGGVSASILSAPGIEPRVRAVLPAACPFTSAGNPSCQALPGGLDIGSPSGSLGSQTADTGGGLDGIPDIRLARIGLPNLVRGQQYNARLDYQQGRGRFALSTYVTRRDDQVSDRFALGRPIADLTLEPLSSAVTLIYDRVLSATLVNEARFSFASAAADFVGSSSHSDFGIPRTQVVGPVDSIGFGFGGPWERPGAIGDFSQRTYEVRNLLTKTLGSQSVKVGGEIQWEHVNDNLITYARPGYLFRSLFDLANDAPYSAVLEADSHTGSPADQRRRFRTNYYGVFVQDDWKLSPDLTLNMGVRYEYFTPLRERDGLLTNLELASRSLADSKVVSVDRMHDPDVNNVAPRVGFAWSPQRFNSRMVLRGGFGISYNRTPTALLGNTRGNPPSSVRYYADEGIRYARGTSRSPFSFPSSLASVDGTLQPWRVVWGTPKTFPNSSVYSYSLEGSYQLTRRLVSSISYTGSSSRHLIRIVDQNFVFDDRNPEFDHVFFASPDAKATYNAFSVRLTREFADGFSLEGSYRLSRSVDMLSYEGPGQAYEDSGAAAIWTNPHDPQSEMGPSDFDVRHYLVVTGVWELPFARERSDVVGKIGGGWRVSGILTAHSGFPWTPKSDDLFYTPGLSYQRPSRQLRPGPEDPSTQDFIDGLFPRDGGGQYFDLKSGPPGIGRNSMRGPRYLSVDLTLGKRTSLWGRTHLDLRANCFNALNTLNLEPFGFLSKGTFIEYADFGRVDGALAGRVIELQARFSF